MLRPTLLPHASTPWRPQRAAEAPDLSGRQLAEDLFERRGVAVHRRVCAGAAGVNEAVWTSVRDLLLDSDAFAQELAAWVERQTTTPSDQDVRTRKAEGRLEELTRQRDRLTDAYQIGALALDPFRTRIQALEANHAAAELALAEIKSEHLEVELVRSLPL